MGFNEIDQDDRVAHDCVVKEKWYMGFNFSFFLSLQKKKNTKFIVHFPFESRLCKSIFHYDHCCKSNLQKIDLFSIKKKKYWCMNIILLLLFFLSCYRHSITVSSGL